MNGTSIITVTTHARQALADCCVWHPKVFCLGADGPSEEDKTSSAGALSQLPAGMGYSSDLQVRPRAEARGAPGTDGAPRLHPFTVSSPHPRAGFILYLCFTEAKAEAQRGAVAEIPLPRSGTARVQT